MFKKIAEFNFNWFAWERNLHTCALTLQCQMIINFLNKINMKTMALNSVQNSQSTVATTQFFASIGRAIAVYGKNEELVTTMVMICALVVMVGVALMSVATMIAGAVALVISFAPTAVRWSIQDYNKEI